MSEEERVDRLVQSLLRKGTYGALAGGLAALLMFRHPSTRSSVFSFGLGCGVGASFSEVSEDFERLTSGLGKAKSET